MRNFRRHTSQECDHSRSDEQAGSNRKRWEYCRPIQPVKTSQFVFGMGCLDGSLTSKIGERCIVCRSKRGVGKVGRRKDR